MFPARKMPVEGKVPVRDREVSVAFAISSLILLFLLCCPLLRPCQMVNLAGVPNKLASKSG